MSRLIFYHPLPDWGGLARVYVELGKALAGRGATVAVVCPGGSSVAEGCRGLDVIPFDDRGAWLSDGNRLAGVLREFSADAVCVAHDDPHLTVAWAVRRSGRGAVLRRVPTGAEAEVSLGTRLAVRLAPTWFVHTSAAEAKASEPVSRLRGRVIADLAIDPSPLERVIAAPTPIGTSTLVVVTDPYAQRATAAALRTVATLRGRGHPVRAILVGTPHDVNEVRVHATALGLGDALTILGDPIDRAPVLAAADAVWITADRDDGGIAVLDAMALGRTPIVTRGVMAERFVTHDQTGIVVDRDDALSTAAVITLLQADASLLEQIGHAAQLSIRARRGLSASADAFMAVLNEAATARVAA